MENIHVTAQFHRTRNGRQDSNRLWAAKYLAIAYATVLTPLASADIIDGLILHYTFDGDAIDQTGNLYDGQIFGATLAPDRFGTADSAYSFDGDDYIVTSATGLPEAERTVALWMLPTTEMDERPIAAGYGKGCGTTWIMYANEGGYRLITHCGGTPNILAAYGCRPEYVWTHFAVTVGASESTIYVDGVASGVLGQQILTVATGTEFAVGAATHVSTGLAPYTDVNVRFFIGSIDDVRVYDRALTPAEISELATGVGDQDSDGVIDSADNCVWRANANQADTNADGIGNFCDADLNSDCVVNAVDLGLFRNVFFTPDADADFDGNGIVNVLDLGILKTSFFAQPGPSGVVNACRCVL